MQEDEEESLLITMSVLAVIFQVVQRRYHTQVQAILRMLVNLLRDFFHKDLTVLLKDFQSFIWKHC